MDDVAASDIEVIELTAPAEAQAHEGVRQWATLLIRAAPAQRAQPLRVGSPANGAGGARTFYWWMLVAALAALALA